MRQLIYFITGLILIALLPATDEPFNLGGLITPSVTLNSALTATATDAEGNTSEFSQCYTGAIATYQNFLPLVKR